MPLKKNEILINDSTDPDLIFNPRVGGETKGHGAVPRDYSVQPRSMFKPPSEMQVIPESEWSDRIKEKVATKSQISDIRMHALNGQMIPALDQNGQGFCALPGSLITLANGSTKPVEEFTGGEEVVSHGGNVCKVIRPTGRRYTGNLYALGRRENELTVTANHPVWTERGWVRADELQPEDTLYHSGRPVRLGDTKLEAMPVTDEQVHCLQVAGDHSFRANGWGVHNCWSYSTGSAIMMLRALAHQPYVRVSPHGPACIIKRFRDEGGWGALSLQFAMEKGYPSEQFWPQKSMSKANDKPETWANAALHKVTEGWVDMSADAYDRKLSFQQVATCLLLNVPVVVDFNWWSHSVCAIDLVEIEKGSFGVRILNSWGDGWSEQGTGVLQGNKARPDGAVAPYGTLASGV